MQNKINVGVVGVGNLGKSIIKQLKNHNQYNLVAVFSRRKIKNTINLDKIMDYKGKIDLLFLCLGSSNDLEPIQKMLIPYFNTIDSYDNHQRLKTHINTIDKIAKENNKIALCSIGWDPGLFSYMRSLFSSLNYEPFSFWGKGTSQGHTQAIKQIDGVIDAIQFTVPNQKNIDKIKSGKCPDKTNHFRECYVVCEKSQEERIKNEIINIPNYFLGQKTTVNFVDNDELKTIKSFAHKGEVFTKNNVINFSLNLPSNPDFTASVMLAYAKSYLKLKEKKMYGAFVISDIPLTYIIEDKFKYL